MTIVLADLGGTHLRLAKAGDTNHIQKFVITDYPDIETVLRGFCKNIDVLYLAAAIQPRNGIIEDKRFGDKSHWIIHLETLQKNLGVRKILVVNDLEAAAYGLLAAKDMALLVKPTHNQTHFINPPKLIVGVGTGIGHAYLFGQEDSHAFVQRSHGGHMPPLATTPQQHEILAKIKTVKPSSRDMIVEDIVSGAGLKNLQLFLEKPQSFKLFAEFLGAYCNGLVSACGAYGGVYLTGGVMDDFMQEGTFDIGAFETFFKPAMVPVVQESLSSTPVYYIRETNMPVLGLEEFSKRAGR